MIRRVVIVLLTVGAVGTGASAIAAATLCSRRISWERNRSTGPFLVGVELGHGVLTIMYGCRAGPPRKDEGREIWRRPGVAIGMDRTSDARAFVAEVSFAYLTLAAVALATYPTVAFIRGPLRRWRRRRKGLCITCGYDLTGNVTGTCSECGAKL